MLRTFRPIVLVLYFGVDGFNGARLCTINAGMHWEWGRGEVARPMHTHVMTLHTIILNEACVHFCDLEYFLIHKLG